MDLPSGTRFIFSLVAVDCVYKTRILYILFHTTVRFTKSKYLYTPHTAHIHVCIYSDLLLYACFAPFLHCFSSAPIGVINCSHAALFGIGLSFYDLRTCVLRFSNRLTYIHMHLVGTSGKDTSCTLQIH